MARNENMEAIIASVQHLGDMEIWLLAVTMVSFAGQRAQNIGRIEVEEACIEFVDDMHKLVGTPPIRDLTVN